VGVKKRPVKIIEDYLDEAEKEAAKQAAAQKHLCGSIASTMDEDMFTMVISKWHEFATLAEQTKDWKPLAAAGGAMKDMVRKLLHLYALQSPF
jgi:hypothetical protein